MNIVHARLVRLPRRSRPDSISVNRAFYADLFGRHRRQVDEALLERGNFHDHQGLVDSLLADGPPPRADLIAVAHALPDLLPFTAVGPYIDHKLNGNDTGTLCLGISQSGIGAPFIALKVGRAYAKDERYAHAAFFILEQATQAGSRPGVPLEVLADSGVLLVTAPAPGLAVTHLLSAGDGAALEDLALGLLAEGPPAQIILGNALAWSRVPGTVSRVPKDQHATAVWAALADLYASGVEPARVLIADADPVRGDFHLALLERAPGGAPA